VVVAVLTVLAIATGVLLGLVIYRFVEQPLMRRLRGKRAD